MFKFASAASKFYSAALISGLCSKSSDGNILGNTGRAGK
ncbi:hypothetical protein RAMDARK_0789 [Rickettsia amblyommatis str. Darkwater]|uniref:Uncharacterized protein n=1 Tax=Rickettsia amblyommatis str. Ac/Pa TaxID=1359164 RepID=A0A0F3N254_RICAM|nr:hypothetical protein APHACPA_1083 [Rickettsia amblyommatis str. Ac/Pa]KJV94976.1 hypothetical protein RAMDARK_0789 [Rickettsia amblyommatis str. Darkwater]